MGVAVMVSPLAQAQSGTLTYGPIPEEVPVLSPAMLALTMLLVAAIAGWAVRTSEKDRVLRSVALAGAVFLGAAASAGLLLSPKLQARVAVLIISLDEDAGGTVSVPAGSGQFRNATSLLQVINGLSSPCSGGNPNTALSAACEVGLGLQPGEQCNTEYNCAAVD